MGQHFLVDQVIIQRIIDGFNPAADDHVLEIGPGQGALTDPLLGRVASLLAVELDGRLARSLQARYPEPPLTVLHHDILSLDFEAALRHQIPDAERFRLIGNLPYSVATPILVRMMPRADLFTDITVMVQREVARRMLAGTGEEDYGPLAVLTALHTVNRKLITHARPGAFAPPPEVVSSVVQLTLPAQAVAPGVTAGAALARAAFLHRRKQLTNALAQVDTGSLNAALEQLQIPRDCRPEHIHPEQYVRLAALLPPGTP